MNLSRLTAPYFFRKNNCSTFLTYLQEAESNQWKSPKEIRAIQQRKLQRLLESASQHVPYYRRLFQEQGIDLRKWDESLFEKIPLLTKLIIQKEENTLLAEGVDRGQLLSKQSSGSTGVPTKVYLDTDRAHHSWAYNLRHNRWAGYDWGCRVGSLWGTPDHAVSDDVPKGWKERSVRTLKDTITGRIRELYLNPFNYSEEEMADYVQRLQEFRPHILLGYSNSLHALAQFVQARGVSVRVSRGIITGGETLLPEARHALEEVFHSRVYDRYGTREVDIIASECEQGQLHLNEDNLLVEILPEPGLETGGRVVVTDLNNFVMPLIRYDLGDIASFSPEPCRCGRGLAVLSRVQGRYSEHFKTRDGRIISGYWFNILVRKIPGLQKYQVRQTDYEAFRFLLVCDPLPEPEAIRRMEEEVRELFGSSSTFDIQFVEDIPTAGTGKYHYLISEVR